MGGSVWGDSDRKSYTETQTRARLARTATEHFTNTSVSSVLNPNGVMLRESCDSEANPNSNAIILGLDVTGSMGYVAHEIAKEGLGHLIEGIHERKPVEDPHIMFMAIGDVRTDRAPLQLSQFEADIRIVEQLNEIFVEGNGGGNGTESYDLPWYFAGNHTKIDCFEKRQKKGYLFTVGDEDIPRGLSQQEIKSVFGYNDERGYSAQELLSSAQEKYHVFHLLAEEGSNMRMGGSRRENIVKNWRELLGMRAVLLQDAKYISQVILSLIAVSEGASVSDTIDSWEDSEVKAVVEYAFSNEG
jgi:hypothetical protein